MDTWHCPVHTSSTLAPENPSAQLHRMSHVPSPCVPPTCSSPQVPILGTAPGPRHPTLPLPRVGNVDALLRCPSSTPSLMAKLLLQHLHFPSCGLHLTLLGSLPQSACKYPRNQAETLPCLASSPFLGFSVSSPLSNYPPHASLFQALFLGPPLLPQPKPSPPTSTK